MAPIFIGSYSFILTLGWTCFKTWLSFIHSSLRIRSFFAEAPWNTVFFSPGSHNNFFWHHCNQSIYHSLHAQSFLPAILIYYWQGWVLKLLLWLQIIGRELWQRDTFVFFSPFLYSSHVAHFRGREMFLLGSETGFPFMSVFDIRDMLWP